MADATQGDTDVQYLGLLVPALITLIAGLLIHSFIIGVNVSDWWKGRSVTAVDHVVTSLGISRMCTQCAFSLYLLLGKIFSGIQDPHVCVTITGAINSFFLCTNFWLTSLLSIVLCLKISNFHSRLFLYLRGVIEHRTGSLIVASALLSTVMSFIPLISKFTNGGTRNTTMANRLLKNIFIIYFPKTTGPLIPLFCYCTSSVLLFSSLYHHTTKMKMSSNLSISLEKYYSVMRFVSATFIYNTIYLFFCAIYITYFYIYDVGLSWLLLVLGFLHVYHSSYLIYTTAKLRSQMSKVLQNVINFLSQRKDTETRENIEVVAQ